MATNGASTLAVDFLRQDQRSSLNYLTYPEARGRVINHDDRSYQQRWSTADGVPRKSRVRGERRLGKATFGVGGPFDRLKLPDASRLRSPGSSLFIQLFRGVGEREKRRGWDAHGLAYISLGRVVPRTDTREFRGRVGRSGGRVGRIFHRWTSIDPPEPKNDSSGEEPLPRTGSILFRSFFRPPSRAFCSPAPKARPLVFRNPSSASNHACSLIVS